MRKSFIFIMLILTFSLCCEAQNLFPKPNKKNMWGYVNEKGKYVIKPIFQSADQFTSNMACVKANDEYGFINRSGETIIEFEYNEMHPSDNKKFYIGKKNGDAGVYIISLSSGNIDIKRYDNVYAELDNGFYPVIIDGKFGYIDAYGILAVRADYIEKPIFSSSGIAVSHKESGYGLIKKDFTSIVPERYGYVRNLSNGYYIFGDTDTAFGLVTDTGEIKFPSDKYSLAKIIEGKNLIEVSQDNNTSILDLKGNVIVAACNNYSISGEQLTYSTDQSTEKINLGSGARAININGKEVWTAGKAVSIKYEDPFISWTDTAGKVHMMTVEGNAIFDGYSNVTRLSKGIYSVENNGKCAVADASGKILSEWCDKILPINDEYIQLVKSYQRSIFDQGASCAIMRISNAKLVTPHWNLAWVYSPQKNGLIPVKRLNGDTVKLKMMGDSYYVVDNPSEGMCRITDSNTYKMGIMTEDGKVLVSPKYDKVGKFNSGMCRVFIAGKGYGFINKSGKLVISCKYPEALEFGTLEGVTNYTQVWDIYGNTYYIDKKGNIADPNKVRAEVDFNLLQSSWY